MNTTTRPEWLVPGAKVITWMTGTVTQPPHWARGEVIRVNVKSFTVDIARKAEPVRFPTAADRDGDHRVSAGTFNSLHCAHVDSEIGAAQLDAWRIARLRRAAHDAVTDWQDAIAGRREMTDELTDNAIAALTAWRNREN